MCMKRPGRRPNIARSVSQITLSRRKFVASASCARCHVECPNSQKFQKHHVIFGKVLISLPCSETSATQPSPSCMYEMDLLAQRWVWHFCTLPVHLHRKSSTKQKHGSTTNVLINTGVISTFRDLEIAFNGPAISPLH